MERLSRDVPLTVVAAPPGFGKTHVLTSLRSRVEADGGHVVYVELSDRFNDRIAVWGAVIDSLRARGVLSDHMSVMPRSVGGAELQSSVRHALANVCEPAVIVFDNAQWMTDPRWADDLVAAAAASDSLHLIVAEREMSRIPDRAAAHGLRYQAVTSVDLSFTRSEIAEILAQQVGTDVPSDVISRVFLHTSGRPSSVLRAASELSSSTDLNAWSFDHPADFVSAVLRNLSTSPSRGLEGGFMRILHVLSVSNRVPLGLVYELVGPETVARHLSEIDEARLGSWSREGRSASPVFRWDEEMREAVRTLLPEFGGAHGRRLRGQIVEWCVRNPELETSLEIMLIMEELDAADRIARASMRRLLARPNAMYGDHLLAYDTSRLAGFSSLYMLAALIRMKRFGLTAETAALLRSFSRTASMRSFSKPLERLYDLAGASASAALVGDVDLARSLSVKAHDLAIDLVEGGEVGDRALFAAACSFATWGLVRAFDLPRAATLWTLVLQYSSGSEELVAQDARLGIAFVNAALGYGDAGTGHSDDDNEERRVLQDGLDASRVHFFSMRAWKALDELRPEDALAQTRRALSSILSPQQFPVLILTHVFALWATGRATEARVSLMRWMPDAMTGRPSGDDLAAAMLAGLLALVDGRTGASRRVELPIPGSTLLAVFSRGLALLVTGDPKGTLAEIGAYEDLVDTSPRLRGLVALLAAAAALRLGHALTSLQWLELATAVQEEYGTGWNVMMIPLDDIRALREAATERGFHRAVRMLDQGDEMVHPIPARITSLNVTERELQVLRLISRSKTNAEIARELFVSVNTVKFHVAGLYRTLGVSTRDEAVDAGLRLGLLVASSDLRTDSEAG